MKRIKLTHGTALVGDNVSEETVAALNRMSELVFELKPPPDKTNKCISGSFIAKANNSLTREGRVAYTFIDDIEP